MGWLEELEAQAEELEGQCQQMGLVAKEVTELQLKRDLLVKNNTALVSEGEELEIHVEELTQKLEWLQEEVGKTERLIQELGHRYLQREGEAQKVEHRLNEATRGLKEMSRLGLPVARIPELASHLTYAARSQGINPEHFLDWFLSCLQGASSLLGLESRVKAKQEELVKLELNIAEIEKEVDASHAQLLALKKQRAEEEAAHRELRETWRAEVLDIGATLKYATSQEVAEIKALGISFREDLAWIQKECRETAIEWGQLEEAIDSHPMVRPLISLLQGKHGQDPGEMRVVGTAFCLALMGCLEREGQDWKASSVSMRVKELLQGLERWKI